LLKNKKGTEGMINERLIQYLLAVEEKQNITAAAKELYISQPALSRMILNLEKSLDTPLFVRDRGSLHPTQAGEIYLNGCREVLAVSHSVHKQIADIKDSRGGRIVLGVTAVTGEFLLPRILDEFEREYPDVELVLHEDKIQALQNLTKSGRVDLTLIYQQDEELECFMVAENPVYIQVPPDFARKRPGWAPGKDNPSLLPKDLMGQKLILLKKGRGMRAIADHFLEHFDIQPGGVFETENIHLASNLVQLNCGFTFIPGIFMEPLMQSGQRGYYCQVSGYPMKRSLYCCHRKDVYLTQAEQYLISLVRKTGMEWM
jgi:DNA-binding transcriptional LysR family regulator